MSSILTIVTLTTQSRKATVNCTYKEKTETRGTKQTGEKTDKDIIIVFKYLEEKENCSPYSMSMGKIIMNIHYNRDIFLMKWIIAKQSGSSGKAVECPCLEALVSR